MLPHYFEEDHARNDFICGIGKGNPSYFTKVDVVRERGFEFELWKHNHPSYVEDVRFFFICPRVEDGWCEYYEVDFLYNVDYEIKKEVGGAWGIAIARFRCLVINDILFHLGNGESSLKDCINKVMPSEFGYPFKQWKKSEGEDNKDRWQIVRELTKDEFMDDNKRETYKRIAKRRVEKTCVMQMDSTPESSVNSTGANLGQCEATDSVKAVVDKEYNSTRYDVRVLQTKGVPKEEKS